MSGVDLNIDVRYLTRVEGHGNIVVNVKKGEVEDIRFEVVEAPRFFEAMLRGRRYDEAPVITCRICGICSVAHTTASLKAVESALGIEPSEQTLLLRKLNLNAEMLESHILHVYFLAAPDLFGAKSVFPLIKTHKDVVLRGMKLKGLSMDLCAVVAGNHTHLSSMEINGFASLPSEEDLAGIRERLVDARGDMEATVKLFSELKWPDFERETEYISLKKPGEYAFYDGDIYSSAGVMKSPAEYREMTNEFVVPHSTAKRTKHLRESYMVGALARFNNNYDELRDAAKEAAERMGLKAPCYNPFMNNVAQIVESVHCLEDSISIIDKLLERGIKEEDTSFGFSPGTGVGAVEAPRGVLYHEYTVGEDGLITNANCVIPTNQNTGNIEYDMRALVPQILDRPKEEVTLTLEMLVRAYDPCISCSTHFLKVRFVE